MSDWRMLLWCRLADLEKHQQGNVVSGILDRAREGSTSDHYSARSACMGSVVEARYAGTNETASARLKIKIAPNRITAGSHGLI